MINDRISKLSHNQDSFNQASPLYAEALKNSGYKVSMIYTTKQLQENRKTTNRENNAQIKIKEKETLSGSTPYNEEVQINIRKAFFNLVNKHFPAHHKLHKICNKFNLKFSYTCMPNMMSIINNHNENLLHPHFNDKDLPCNC